MLESPPQLQAFDEALHRLAGIVNAQTKLHWLEDLPLAKPARKGPHNDLPFTALRRTEGCRADEVWVCTHLEFTLDDTGWLSLEFLAWWANDVARSGELLQMRPRALPPVVGKEVQFGSTLTFLIDHFFIGPNRETKPILTTMKRRADALNEAINDYVDVLDRLVVQEDYD